jgi:hypothetical protein
MQPFALLGQGKSILDATAALEHERVIGRVVALTDDVRAAQFQGGRQRCRACPLDILVAVASALIRAAHHIDGVQGTECFGGDTLQLRNGGDSAMRRLLVCAEGE